MAARRLRRPPTKLDSFSITEQYWLSRSVWKMQAAQRRYRGRGQVGSFRPIRTKRRPQRGRRRALRPSLLLRSTRRGGIARTQLGQATISDSTRVFHIEQLWIFSTACGLLGIGQHPRDGLGERTDLSVRPAVLERKWSILNSGPTPQGCILDDQAIYAWQGCPRVLLPPVPLWHEKHRILLWRRQLRVRSMLRFSLLN